MLWRVRNSRGRPRNAPAVFIVAVLLIAAVPVYAEAQSPSVPRVSKDDAHKVATIISGDKAKTQTYCDIQKLAEQMEQAYEKKNLKLVDELSDKIETLEKTLGPEYAALVDGLEHLDLENDKLGAEIMLEFAALNMLCAR
jgi:flagellar motility protein MotE (MotC chaperone)